MSDATDPEHDAPKVSAREATDPDPARDEPTVPGRDAPARPRPDPARDAPTRRLRSPAPEEPTPRRRPGRGSWAALALATACGFLLGALVVTTLSSDTTTRTETRQITVPGTVTGGGTVITKTLVPPIVGEPLDVAKVRAERAKFTIEVDSGGGVFGVIRDENWEVVAQRPGAEELIEQGSTIHVDIVKR